MPPLCMLQPSTGKQPPPVLPPDLAMLANVGDGTGWPKCLVHPKGAGLLDPACLLWQGDIAANDPAIGR
jgi:hypothetical protein